MRNFSAGDGLGRTNANLRISVAQQNRARLLSVYPMFLILLGGSLTFGAALLATVIYTDGALVALRSAAEMIGWL